MSALIVAHSIFFIFNPTFFSCYVAIHNDLSGANIKQLLLTLRMSLPGLLRA